jgi:hypothetical protein
MVRFVIDIEAIADDPEAANILLKTNSDQATEAEEATAQRLLPALRDVLRSGFPEGDESQQPVAEETSSPH